MILKDISSKDTTFYKGLAIMLILFHNFFHWMKNAPGENEITFAIDPIINYVNALSTQFSLVIQYSFSIWGHYGVQVFIFLSAYGLTKKYFSQEDRINYFSFVKKRIGKIYIPFLIAIVVWALYNSALGWTYGYEGGFIDIIRENYYSLLLKLSFLSNFSKEELFSVVGPWWFVSLIVQLYLLFPILLKVAKKEKGDIYLAYIVGGSILLTMILYFVGSGFFVYGTAIGHLPEFILGIYLAQKKEINIHNAIIGFSIFLFILSQFSIIFWFFVGIPVTLLLIFTFQKIKTILEKTWINILILEVGISSMFIFYLNGFMRQPLVGLAKHYENWMVNILIAIIFFIVVLFVSMLLTRGHSFISKKLV